METQVIKYESEKKQIPNGNSFFDDVVTDGLRCLLETVSTSLYVHCFWRFHWDEHFQSRIETMTGNITLKWNDENNQTKSHTEKIIFGGATFHTIEFPSEAIKNETVFFYEYSVEVVRRQPEIVDYELMFTKSDLNNFPLEIEGKIIFVNKDLLAVYSKYFECLFSDQFADSKKSKISIGMVTIEEFGMLLSKFYPPHLKDIEDIEVEDLIRLAKIFDLEIVLKNVQDHLIIHSKIEPTKIMWIAETHLLPKVIDGYLEKFSGKRNRYFVKSHYYPLLSQELRDKIDKL